MALPWDAWDDCLCSDWRTSPKELSETEAPEGELSVELGLVDFSGLVDWRMAGIF